MLACWVALARAAIAIFVEAWRVGVVAGRFAITVPPLGYGLLHGDSVHRELEKGSSLGLTVRVAGVDESTVAVLGVRGSAVLGHRAVEVSDVLVHLPDLVLGAILWIGRTLAVVCDRVAHAILRASLVGEVGWKLTGIDANSLPRVESRVERESKRLGVRVGMLREVALPLVFGFEGGNAVIVESVSAVGKGEDLLHLRWIHIFAFDSLVLKEEARDSGCLVLLERWCKGGNLIVHVISVKIGS